MAVMRYQERCVWRDEEWSARERLYRGEEVCSIREPTCYAGMVENCGASVVDTTISENRHCRHGNRRGDGRIRRSQDL